MATWVLVLLSVLFGVLLGIAFWSYLASQDDTFVRLQEDEVVIKRPHEGFVLVQVTLAASQKLLGIAAEALPNSEARGMYPVEFLARAMRDVAPGLENRVPDRPVVDSGSARVDNRTQS